MAKKKRKYSYNDREDYYGKRFVSFLHQFEVAGGYDYDALEAAERRSPKMQYADGYSTFTNGISRGYRESEEDLKKKSAAFQRGYKAANSAYEKSRNIKF